MKLLKIVFAVTMVLALVSSVAGADDFGRMRDFNIRAEVDPSGFRARLATRFEVGDLQIKAILSRKLSQGSLIK